MNNGLVTAILYILMPNGKFIHSVNRAFGDLESNVDSSSNKKIFHAVFYCNNLKRS